MLTPRLLREPSMLDDDIARVVDDIPMLAYPLSVVSRLTDELNKFDELD